MAEQIIPQDVFNQKKVGHIFHYTKTFDSVLGILTSGFQPSYCQENIDDLTYLIPMVSFLQFIYQGCQFIHEIW